MDISHILNELNDKQREAVTAEPNNLLVLAGAGSGKTRVLVYRIAWLVEVEKFSPFNILAVTFTNKAAREMKSRIEGMLGMPANNMWVGTFHGLAHRLLRAHWEAAGLPQNFQILDSDDQYRLVRRVIRTFELDEAKWPPKQAQWFINKKKENGLRPADLPKSHDHFENTMRRIYEEYENICQQSGLIDFTEMLLRTYDLWRNNPDILQHYQRRFRYVLVDEFQDTNTLQYAWLKLLNCDTNNMMIVGDDDQSIYSWRGACIDNIHRFSKEFKNTTTIRLEQNYRSTGNILSAANQLISYNSDRLGKNLWTSSDEGELISLYAAFNEFDEARFIVDQIKKWQNDGGKLSESAMLYRSNAQSRILEEALIQAGVPYRIYGGLRFFERAEIKDALAYLHLINHRDNDAALERIINTPTRGIGNRTVEFVREYAREHQQSLFYAATQIAKEGLLPARATNALNVFIELIEELAVAIESLDLHEKIEHVLHYSGLREHIKKDRSEKGRARLENLEELVTAARQFDPEESDENVPELSAFLSHAALEAGETQAAAHHDCVQLMTLHSAKGLEFPLVFVTGLEEGLFPHQMSMEELQGLEEERRLCYVGMTRAMKKLYLCYAESRSLYGKEKMQSPSRFIKEIPAEFLEEVRFKTKVSMPLTRRNRSSGSGSSLKQTEASELGLRVGQPVRHQKFGDGVILNIEGDGPKARLQINFNRQGSKWLMAGYANLEVI